MQAASQAASQEPHNGGPPLRAHTHNPPTCLDGGNGSRQVGRSIAQCQQRDAAQPRRQAQVLGDLGEDAGEEVVGCARDDAEQQAQQHGAAQLRGGTAGGGEVSVASGMASERRSGRQPGRYYFWFKAGLHPRLLP